MSQPIVIEVEPRENLGKNASRRLRRAGLIPAVVYGGGREPVGVQVDPRPVEAALHSPMGLNTLIQLKLAGRDLRRMVLIREIQRHPVTEQLLHVDFVRVEMDQKIEVSVPVELVGTPVGVKSEGGIVDFVHRQVVIKCLPGNIPGKLVADISGLHVGQHFEAGQLELPEGSELVTPPTETICTVAGKKAGAEEAEAEAAEAAEAEAGEAPAAGDEAGESGD